jgi:uncharacterized protein YukE
MSGAGTLVNPLVVAESGGDKNAWSGIYLAEDIQLLHEGVASGSWVDSTLGGVGLALDGLGLMVDPLGTLAAWGVAWLLDHVKPLSDALDVLAGNPGEVAACAMTWRNASAQLAAAAQGYAGSTTTHLDSWSGTARTAYDAHAQEHVGGLDALARACDTMGTIVEGAGMLVALVRTIVRDLIAEFVSILAVRLWEWLAEEAATLGIGTPWVIAQVSALVAKWVNKIAHFFRALVNSLRKLSGVLRQLAHLIENLMRRGIILGRVGAARLRGHTSPESLLDPKGLRHITSGDGPFSKWWKGEPGGGHMWPGLRGKTAFPKDWDLARIEKNVSDVASDPASVIKGRPNDGRVFSANGVPIRWRVYGERDGVMMRVVFEPATGRIVTAFPWKGAPV